MRSDAMRSGVTRAGIRLRRLVLAYLVLLPLGQLFTFRVAGAVATLTDALLLVLVAATSVAVAASLVTPATEPPLELPRRGVGSGLLLLLGFGLWVAASSIWGYHPAYAGAKGMGVVALAVGAYAVAGSRTRPATLVDYWLVGTSLVLVVSWLGALLGPAGLRDAVLYRGGGVSGLPLPRLSGPLPHPNLFGEYLALSGLLLWSRWPAWSDAGRGRLAGSLAALLVLGLVATVSSGWLVAGAGATTLAFVAPGWSRPRRLVVGAGGAVLVIVVLVGAVRPVTLSAGSIEVSSGAIRPEIWADATNAVRSRPLVGVGAAPYLAETVDPGTPADGAVLWDAHSTYLSVAGQFGLFGGALFFGGLVLVARGVTRAGRGANPRLRAALLAATVALLVHWLTLAGEDFRHLWALIGVAGAVAVGTEAPPAPGRDRAGRR